MREAPSRSYSIRGGLGINIAAAFSGLDGYGFSLWRTTSEGGRRNASAGAGARQKRKQSANTATATGHTEPVPRSSRMLMSERVLSGT